MGIYSEQVGHGPDVVLIHGWGLHGGLWSEVARELSADYRVTIPDLPGHGRSRDFMPRDFSPEVLAEEVQHVLPGPAIWVGWSLGGLVALAAAQQYPQEVVKLVLVGATPKFTRSVDWPHAMEPAVLDQFALDLERDYIGTLTRFLSLQISAEENLAVLRRMRDALFCYGEPATTALRAGLQLLKEEDRRDGLATINAPTLLIHGDRDRLTSVGAARFLAAQLPQAQLELIHGAGHVPFLSHSSHFLEKVKDFMHG